jgi:hypothetical protein
MMPGADLGSRIVVVAAVSFGLWIALLRILRPVSAPVAGFLAALLSWVGACLSARWLIAMLRHTRFWPLV